MRALLAGRPTAPDPIERLNLRRDRPGDDLARTPNLFLAGLPEATVEPLRPHLERVRLPFRRVVAEPYQPIPWVYFPETGVFSVTVELVDGSSIEVNLVGREGFTSIAAFLGVSAPLRVATLVSGTFLRMGASAFADAVQRDRVLLDRTYRYIQALLSVRALSVGCDRAHAVRPRLARWLLKIHDRVGVDEFRLTHDVVALMLGVARPTVTVNALSLEHEGLIEYHRGHIRILDRRGLEDVACECYGTVRSEFERLLGWTIG